MRQSVIVVSPSHSQDQRRLPSSIAELHQRPSIYQRTNSWLNHVAEQLREPDKAHRYGLMSCSYEDVRSATLFVLSINL